MEAKIEESPAEPVFTIRSKHRVMKKSSEKKIITLLVCFYTIKVQIKLIPTFFFFLIS